MRTFIIVLLLIAASYWLYTKYPPHANGGDELPAQIAWRTITHDQRGVVTFIEVDAVSGNCWRMEVQSPPKPKTLVAVFDGNTAAASVPQAPAASFDPRPTMRQLLSSIRRATPEATEQIGGHPYLRFTQTFKGISVQIWADPQTRFPYRLRGGALGQFTDITYTILPAPSDRDRTDLFSVQSLTPHLSRFATTQ